MSGSDTEQEHPSDCFSGPPAKGLELSFTTTHNNLFSKVVLLPKTKAQAGCGCSTNLQTPSSVLPNGKPDTDWQSGCWCLPPKESVWMRGECNGIPLAISSISLDIAQKFAVPGSRGLPVQVSISCLVLHTYNCLQALAPHWTLRSPPTNHLILASLVLWPRPAELSHRAFWWHQSPHLCI